MVSVSVRLVRWWVVLSTSIVVAGGCASTPAGGEGPAASTDTVTSPLAPQAAPPAGEEGDVAPAPSEAGEAAVAAEGAPGAQAPTEAAGGVSPEEASIDLVGERFSLALPDGFREVDPDEDLARNGLMQATFRSGGLVLLQRDAQDGAERRGVILARGPTKATHPVLNEVSCQQMAAQMARRASATSELPPAMVEVPAGRACGFTLTDPDGITIDNLFITEDGKTWGLQALHDATETQTPEALKQVAASWALAPEARARGQGFSIPIPTGFVAAGEEQAKKAADVGAALILAAQPPAFSEARRGYIWVQPIEGGPGNWSRLSACRELSTSMLAGRPATAQAERIDVVAFPTGKTCRVQIADSADPLGRVITMPVTRAERVFVVTCNLDVRDEDTRQACQRIATELLPAEG
jgi:hypothetical protein